MSGPSKQGVGLYRSTVKLGYNEHAWDQLILFAISVIRYNREDLCTNVAIWDQKFQL